MLNWAGMGISGAAATGVAVVVVVGVLGYFVLRPDAAPPPGVAVVVPGTGGAPASEPALEMGEPALEFAEPAPEMADPTPEMAEPAPPPAAVQLPAPPPAPSFDVVRVEPGGTTLIAGRAAGNAKITVWLDDAPIGSEEADGQGGFVAMLMIDPAEVPRVLSLTARLGDQETAGQQTVIISPAPPQTVTAPSPPSPETVNGVLSQAPEPGTPPRLTLAPEDITPPERSAQPPTAPATPGAAPGETVAPPQSVARITQPAAPSLGQNADQPPQTQSQITPPAETSPTQAPRVILADDLGVRVLQDPGRGGPVAVAQVSIDTITYDDQGDVVLGGRGSAAAYVRVYLDNTPIRTTQINEDGQWRADLPRIDTRVYTLRVDEIEENGAVLSRAETPFQPESPADVVAETANQGGTPVQLVTVQPGFTLWRIARENYGQGRLYVRVFEANADKIRDPDLIYPGQIFTVPESRPENISETVPQ